MIYSLDKLRELIPHYLNNTLSEKERKAFEDALRQDPELKIEIEEFAEIKQAYYEIEKDVPPPSELLHQRVLKNIQPQIKLSLIPQKKGYREQIRGFLKWVVGSPRMSWGLVIVQFAIILLLLITLPRGGGFKTLTSRQPLLGEGVKINVIFDKESREREIREVLNSVGATIVMGPSIDGLYIVQIKEGQNTEKVLKQLKKTGIVEFAEKAY
jgi:hypothetical protein